LPIRSRELLYPQGAKVEPNVTAERVELADEFYVETASVHREVMR